jgi:tetratricopeptide (TPR) repeat protein
MKNAIIFLLGCVIVAGAIVYVNRSKPAPAPAPVATATDTAAPQPAPAPAPVTAAPAIPAAASAPAPVANTNAAPAKSEADIAFGKLMDKLISTNLSAADKHALFEQLRKNHQLDQAIATLQQLEAANPTNPEIPTTIGEAQLNKIRELHDSGDTDTSDLGILAMQADQNFNAALKIDPSNYEAQLVKSISMTYWPADPTRDAQVVQTFTSLIDQQESMPANPDFAQTYIYLGNEYQKIGQPAQAMATWQLGIQKYPDNTILQQKIAGNGAQ